MPSIFASIARSRAQLLHKARHARCPTLLNRIPRPGEIERPRPRFAADDYPVELSIDVRNLTSKSAHLTEQAMHSRWQFRRRAKGMTTTFRQPAREIHRPERRLVTHEPYRSRRAQKRWDADIGRFLILHRDAKPDIRQ